MSLAFRQWIAGAVIVAFFLGAIYACPWVLTEPIGERHIFSFPNNLGGRTYNLKGATPAQVGDAISKMNFGDVLIVTDGTFRRERWNPK